jgi:hypothetical protein
MNNIRKKSDQGSSYMGKINQVRKLNLLTFIQGVSVAVLIISSTLILTRTSIIQAGVFTSATALGALLSPFIARHTYNKVGFLVLITRTATILLVISNLFIPAILATFLGGAISRRAFINLKNITGQIDHLHLPKHATYNAIGYAIGGIVSAAVLSNPIYTASVVVLLAIFSSLYLPKGAKDKGESKKGLSNKDLIITAIYTGSFTPYSNTLAPLILAKTFGEQLAAISATSYSLGAVLAPILVKQFLKNDYLPIYTLSTATLLFATIITTENTLVLLVGRFITGAVLFTGQAKLEMKTQGKKNKHGLDAFWQIISIVDITVGVLVPQIIHKTSINYSVAWGVLGILILIPFSRINKKNIY